MKELFALYGGDIRDFKIMIDSGSYTVTTKGINITIDDYIEFLYEEWGSYNWYVNLDLQFKPEVGLENYLIMCANGLHDAIHVHHRPEPWKYWDMICNDMGPYAGLSPMPRASMTIKREYFLKAHSMHPDVKVHWFGSGAITLIKQFGPYSVDVSSYTQMAGMGHCYFPFGTFYFGRNTSIKNYYGNLDSSIRKQIRKYLKTVPHFVEDRFIKPEDLLSPVQDETEARTAVNVWYFMTHLQSAINEERNLLSLEDGDLIRYSPWYHGWEDKPIEKWS